MIIWILWIVAWACVFAGRDWRLVPLLYALLLAVSVIGVMPFQNDLATYNLATQTWEQILADAALWHLAWAGVAIIIWLFRRRRADD